MYCIHCGVKLADSEKCCPLCGTVPFHPDIPRAEGQPLYPVECYPRQQVRRKGLLGVVTILLLIRVLVSLMCDLSLHGVITWSGYVIGAIALSYGIMVLPLWFRHPNPAVFVPCDFFAIGLYVLYIDLNVKGGWVLGFAFPVIGFVGVLVSAVVILTRYLHRGALYICGGALIALGAFLPLMELLMKNTFSLKYVGWSWYPLVALILLGGALIFLALCRPARETAERKLFL